ncbi:hypothetical protein ACFQ7F_06795 [Streptomyces sp. NPDC056486]|uniref:hypothetical protein n=1 Tax=Streptomyces sp. NPDC056486 TaxID=3345835 RepID=UPI0036CABA17
MITTTFLSAKPRDTAMGVYAAMGGVGATVGLLIGGALGLAVLSTISTSTANEKLPEAASALYRALSTKDSPLMSRAGCPGRARQ